MSVNATPVSSASVISSAASQYVAQTTSTGGSSSSALAEATETPATTAKEAAKGDPVAKRLLAKEAQEKQLEDPVPAKEPGKGNLVDHTA
jgi:hypothetical protein